MAGRTLSERESLNAIGGIGGFKVLINTDSPYVYAKLIVGAVTDDTGILVTAKQFSGKNNSEAADLVGYEIKSNGVYDPLWTEGNSIVIPVGKTVKIIFG